MRRTLVTSLAVAAALLLNVAPIGAIYPGSVRVSGTMPPLANARDFAISPDGNWLVFEADRVVNEDWELWSVPLDGTAHEPIRLTDAPVAGGDVIDFGLSPDGRRVVYRGDLVTDMVVDVFTAPIDAPGGQVRLNAPPGGNVVNYAFTPDSTRVVFTSTAGGATQLYSAPADGSAAAIQLTDAVAGGGVGRFEVAASGTQVVVVGDLRIVGLTEVFSVPVASAGGQVRLNDDPPPGGKVASVSSFTLAPDGSRVLYWGDLTTDGVTTLYSAPIGSAGGQVLLSDPAAPGHVSSARVTPDGQTVVFTGDLDTPNVEELYRAPVDTAAAQQKLTGAPVAGAKGVQFFWIAPDGRQVVFVGEMLANGVRELFAVGLDGVDERRLSQPLVAGGNVRLAWVTPDSSRVVYSADALVDERLEVFSVPLSGDDAPIRLNRPPVAGGQIDDELLTLSPDGSRVLYTGDLVTDGVYEAFSAALHIAEDDVRLNDPLVPGGAVRLSGLEVAPDSSFAVYAADQETPDRVELWATGRGQQPPPPPTNVVATDITRTTATVTWAPPPFDTQVTSSTVTIRLVGDVTPVAVVDVAGATTEAAIDGLTAATNYTAVVVTRNDAGASPPSSPARFVTDGLVRLAGADRYETAAAIALDRFDPSAVDVVYLATGLDFPDALAGGPLAAREGAPILLVAGGTLPEVTAAALTTLAPSQVVALGGTAVVPDEVLAAAATAAGGATTDRLSGPDRFGTAAAIAANFGDAGRVYLATGLNFPDALSGGPLAALDDAPILLAAPGGLPEATSGALAEILPSRVVALGGTTVVPDGVLTAAADAAGGAATDRLSGSDRFATAAAIADRVVALVGSNGVAYVATGLAFPDALTGVPPAAHERAPILLVTRDDLPPATATALEDLAPGRIVVLGGTAAVGADVAAMLEGLIVE
jgi:putative cell wall-binding protein/Tol biopolymer transport system component